MTLLTVTGHVPSAERAVCSKQATSLHRLCSLPHESRPIHPWSLSSHVGPPGSLTLPVPQANLGESRALSPNPHGIPSFLGHSAYFVLHFPLCMPFSSCLYPQPRRVPARWLPPRIPHWSPVPLCRKRPPQGGLSGSTHHVLSTSQTLKLTKRLVFLS